MNILKRMSTEEKIGILLSIGSVILLLFILSSVLNRSIWYDEVITFYIIDKSYLNLILTTSHDVHPPFYYIVVKTVFKFFTLLEIPFDNIILGKVVSIVPFILLLIFNFTKIRKEFGWLASGIFAICLISMPKLMIYGTEIRMYSLGLLFVTLSLFYSYKITKDSSLKNWILLSLFAVSAAYTHYFAGISVTVVYILLFIYLIHNKNKKDLKRFLLSATTSLVLYLPWMFILIDQMQRVKDYFWVTSITLETVQSYFWYIVSPSMNPPMTGVYESVNITIYGILLIIAFIIILFYFLKEKSDSEKNENNFLVLSGIFLLVLTIISGILISLIYRPIFVIRYAIPALACFWLSFSILLSKTYLKKQIFTIVLLIVLVVGTVNVNLFIDSEKQNENTYNEFTTVLNGIGPHDVIIHTNYRGAWWIPENLVKNSFPLRENDDNYHEKLLKIINKTYGLENGGKIWLFSFEEKKDIYKILLKNGNNSKIERIIIFNISSDDSYPKYLYILSKK